MRTIERQTMSFGSISRCKLLSTFEKNECVSDERHSYSETWMRWYMGAIINFVGWGKICISWGKIGRHVWLCEEGRLCEGK